MDDQNKQEGEGSGTRILTRDDFNIFQIDNEESTAAMDKKLVTLVVSHRTLETLDELQAETQTPGYAEAFTEALRLIRAMPTWDDLRGLDVRRKPAIRIRAKKTTPICKEAQTLRVGYNVISRANDLTPEELKRAYAEHAAASLRQYLTYERNIPKPPERALPPPMSETIRASLEEMRRNFHKLPQGRPFAKGKP